MKKYIKSGISKLDDGSYKFDYTSNSADDIVSIKHPQLYRSIHGNKFYTFGYTFNADVDRKERSEFIHFIKGIGDVKIDQKSLTNFIARPLAALDESINLYQIDCLVYPLSGRSNLVTDIVKVVNRFTSHDMSRCSYELVKSLPEEVDFDWKSFEADYGDNPSRFKQMSKYVEEVLLPKIHNSSYFSLADNVKPKYRRYIRNYLNFESDKVKEFEKMDNKNILVVDDINTSGSTLDEVLRILGKINNRCNIYIFTLIGN